MTGGIVTNWSVGPPHPPYATIGISLLCAFSLLLYASLSPLLQQAMIDVLGMRPAGLAQMLHRDPGFRWNLTAMSMLSALFVHASWLHLAGNLDLTPGGNSLLVKGSALITKVMAPVKNNERAEH